MKIEYNKKRIGVGDIVKYDDDICIVAYDGGWEIEYPYYLIKLTTVEVVGAFETLENINRVKAITLISKKEYVKISF